MNSLKNLQQSAENEAWEADVKAVLPFLENRDRDHVWAFCAGQYSQDFRGNPKYLFLYINRYRKDIFAYWLCKNPQVVELIRSLGYEAYYTGSAKAAAAISRTGVLVAEQVKASIPAGLEEAKYLNLWHGVGGVKAVERAVQDGHLVPELAKKYIQYNEYYRSFQLYLAPSSFIAGIAERELGLSEEQIVRAGYPRCLYQRLYERVETYDHNLLQSRALPEDTRIAAYIPSRRDLENPAFFAEAVPDMERLIDVCERQHILMIFKMHPFLEQDLGFLQARNAYRNCPWLLFWDNSQDIYEILDRIDLCIMDFSSMFTDLIAAGVRRFLRYTFDSDTWNLQFPLDYAEATPGEICPTFDSLLDALERFRDSGETENLDRFHDLYWEFSSDDSMERIIEQTISFRPIRRNLPTLYSFDIFDTLISRKTLVPEGIFYQVRDRMAAAGGFPPSLVQDYPAVRVHAEAVLREYYRKSTDVRNSETLEIQFDEIFAHIAAVYRLSQKQAEQLRKWEMEAELENVIPLPEQIRLLQTFLSRGETVVLISNMYLPKEFLRKMLKKAHPALAELPLFVSSESGYTKGQLELYFEVYKSFRPFYDFRRWVHYGDDPATDQNAPRKCGIFTRHIEKPEFDAIQTSMLKSLRSYDGYLVAAMQSRMAREYVSHWERFIISYVALLWVPYVDWVLRDALLRGYQTLYFISRDGHPLKRIADALIAARGLKIKTKYIYASRRAWRIPSFITEVDPCFWQSYANFGDLLSKEMLFDAMRLDEKTFRRIFPAIDPDTIDFTDKEQICRFIDQFRASAAYNRYLLDLAAAERPLVSGYLRQEIDPNERFAVVEYWGRGYTQDTMVRLWQDIVGKPVPVPFYYSRTILPTIGTSIRYNFTTNSAAQFFIEGFFANMPYKSVERYERRKGKIVPVLQPNAYDPELYDAAQRVLPEWARRYAALDLRFPEDTDHLLYEFSLDYFSENRDNPVFSEQIGPRMDAVATYGRRRQFAPPLTEETLDRLERKEILRGDSTLSTCITMSIVRMEEKAKKRYQEMYQIFPGDNLTGGRLLSAEEQARNREFRRRFEILEKRTARFQELYEEQIAKTGVEDMILFAVNGKSLDDVELNPVFAAASRHFRCETVLLGTLGVDADPKTAALIARARYIIIGNPIHLFAKVVFRPETRLVLLRNTPFLLYNAGLSKYSFLKWENCWNRLISTNDVAELQIPSLEAEEAFRKNYGNSGKTDASLLGCCVTDCYFQPDFASESRKKLESRFPAAAGKKVLLYMPTLRTRAGFPQWIAMLDMEVLRDLIGGEYAVVINFNASQIRAEYQNVMELPGFSALLFADREFTMRELLGAADVIVGDYRDAFFESALLDKPVYSTAWDYERFIRSPNMTNNANRFESFLFCPVVQSSEELAEQLAHVDRYDYRPVRAFRERMLGGCDGHSVERVIRYLLEGRQKSERESLRDASFREKYRELSSLGEWFADAYQKAAESCGVENRALLAVNAKSPGASLSELASLLEEALPLSLFLAGKAKYDAASIAALAKEAAAARFILLDSPIPLFCRTVFRKETTVILLAKTPYPLYNRTSRRRFELPWEDAYESLRIRTDCSVLQIPSAGQRQAFLNRMDFQSDGGDRNMAFLYGCCTTDAYFLPSFAPAALEKLHSAFPQTIGKKTVLYMPTLGAMPGRDKLPLDLAKLDQSLPPEYAIVLFLNAGQRKKLKKRLELPERWAEVVSELSPQELIAACDVAVGDYRDTFFEAALLRKPCFSTAFDPEVMIAASHGGLTEKETAAVRFCPLVKSEAELSAALEYLEKYDYRAMDAFREEMFAGCDGHSAERIAQFIRAAMEAPDAL